MGDIAIGKEDPAVVRLDLPGGHAEAGGFAGAVGTQQADNLAGVDLEIDPIHDLAPAIVFDQALHLQDWRHVCPPEQQPVMAPGAASCRDQGYTAIPAKRQEERGRALPASREPWGW